MTFDFESILLTLAGEDLDFVVIGGVAGLLLGSPNVTFDLDVLIAPDPSQIDRLQAALGKLGASDRTAGQSSVDDLISRFQDGYALRVETTYGRLDCLPEVPQPGAPSYRELKERAETFDLSGRTIAHLSIDDLIGLKEGSERARDREQLAVLRRLKERLDEERGRS